MKSTHLWNLEIMVWRAPQIYNCLSYCCFQLQKRSNWSCNVCGRVLKNTSYLWLQYSLHEDDVPGLLKAPITLRQKWWRWHGDVLSITPPFKMRACMWPWCDVNVDVKMAAMATVVVGVVMDLCKRRSERWRPRARNLERGGILTLKGS